MNDELWNEEYICLLQMINAEKAAQEDNDDQDSYSEEVDDKDTGKKFENEIKN